MAYTFRGETEFELGLGLPRLTTARRTSYSPPAVGYQAYDVDLGAVFTWDGSAWIQAAIGDAAQKVESAVAGNIATLDATGDLVDSGFTPGSFATAVHTHTKSEITDFVEADYATAAQGALADTAAQVGANLSTFTNDSGFISDITGESIGDLSDVDTTTAPTEGQLLVWDNTAGAFKPADPSAGGADRVLKSGDTMTGDLVLDQASLVVSSSTGPAEISFVDTSTEFATFGLDTDVLTLNVTGKDLAVGSDGDVTISSDTLLVLDSGDDISVTAVGDFLISSTNVVLTDAALTVNTTADFTAEVNVLDPVNAQNPVTLAYLQANSSASLDGLTDTTITTLAAQEFLVYNGTAWVNRDILDSDIPDLSATYATAAQGAVADTAVQRAGDTMTGALVLSTRTPTADLEAATKGYVDDQLATVSGTLEGLTDTTISTEPVPNSFLQFTGSAWIDHVFVAADITDGAATFATFAQGALADTAVQPGDNTSTLTNDSFVELAGSTMTGALVLSARTPTADLEAASKGYVDDEISTIAGSAVSKLDDLSDVDTTTTTPVTGNGLFFDGTNFVNRDITKSDISDFTEGDYVDVTTDQNIGGIKTFDDDVIIAGDLTINGTATTVNTTDLAVTDNTIVLNDGESGAGVTKGEAGIEVDRGTSDNAVVLWDETNDEWTIGTVGATRALATSFQTTFVIADWTLEADGYTNTYKVLQSTHGIPYVANQVYIVQVYDDTGRQTYMDTVVDQTTGDIILQTAGSSFDGRVIISK